MPQYSELLRPRQTVSAHPVSTALSGLESSDAAVILGTSREKSAYTLWAEKAGLLEPEPYGEHQRLEQDLQAYIAQRFREATGHQTRKIRRIYRNPAFPWAQAQVEYLVLNQGAGLTCGVLPAKATTPSQPERFPRSYRDYCLHQMLVTGRKRWFLALLTLGSDFQVIPMTADEEELRLLALAEKQFWQRVELQVPPAADGSPSTLQTLERLYPPAEGKSVDLSPVALQLHDYISLCHQAQEAAAAARLQANIIKNHLAASGRGHLGDIRVQWLPESRPDAQPITAAASAKNPMASRPLHRCLQVISPEFGLLEEPPDAGHPPIGPQNSP